MPGIDAQASPPSRWNRRSPVLPFIVVVVAVAGLWLIAPSLSAPMKHPLHIDADSLELGEVVVSESYPLILRIKNRSDRPIQVREFQASCTCIKVSPQSMRIGPGGQEKLRITLDLVAANDEQARIGSAALNVSLNAVLETDIPVALVLRPGQSPASSAILWSFNPQDCATAMERLSPENAPIHNLSTFLRMRSWLNWRPHAIRSWQKSRLNRPETGGRFDCESVP